MVLGVLVPVEGLQAFDAAEHLAASLQRGRAVLLPSLDPSVEVLMDPGRRHLDGLRSLLVEHAVAERLKWAKFGKEKGNAKGPDRATTTVGENVALKISAGNKVHFSAVAFADGF